MNRFRRIRTEFGTKALLRTSLLLAALPGLSLFDYFAFGSARAGVIAAAGLALGFLLRRKIAEGVEYYNRAFSIGLFVYSATLLAGDLLGLGGSAKLAVIAATTVAIFGLQFWSLSDPSVVNAERAAQSQAIPR
jgi:hypothetical protein